MDVGEGMTISIVVLEFESQRKNCERSGVRLVVRGIRSSTCWRG